MATVIDDLWPADIATAEELVAPVTILKQQASLLGQRTKNLVEAVVETEPVDYGRFMRHTFTLVVPALSFYRYKLFDVEHPATKLYPLRVDHPDTVRESWEQFDIADEGEFKDTLRKLFADEETKRIITALIAQSTANQSLEQSA
jgi:hypothetical protein